MGKYSLLITVGVMTAVTLMSLQGQRTGQDTHDRQSQREGKVIARQISRSGYNAVLSKARQETKPGKNIDEIVSDVDTLQGDYEGGTYQAWLEKISPTAYKAVSEGRIVVADRMVKHEMGDSYANNKMPGVPEVQEEKKLKATFLDSQAGYCSAVYLQRILPDTEPEDQPEPELVFAPGNDRDDTSKTFSKTLQPGTKLNFILAVDADYTCERRGEELPLDSDYYDYTRPSFARDVSNPEKIKEAPYGMLEELPDSEGWRVAFEDLVFDEKKLWDIKDNGYPHDSPDNGDWDPRKETYGGEGWREDGSGLRDLIDYGGAPDFSDQVLEMELMDPGADSDDDSVAD